MKSPALILSNELEDLLRQRVSKFCGGMTPIKDAFYFQHIKDQEIAAIWCAGEIDGVGKEICDVVCLIIPRVKKEISK